MTILNNELILSKISNISYNNGQKLASTISDIVIKDRNIGFSIDITNNSISEAEIIRAAAIEQLRTIDNVGKITIVLTGNKKNQSKSKHYIDGVKKVILVAAGKGGVGKSTISALIAERLNLAGQRVGIADADIYGPSIPQIFNVHNKPDIIDKKMVPLNSRNIQIISIGFLIKDEAVAWRGPMASKAIYQLLSLTKWDNLDYLIIDMPPGTGDIHLAILENYHVDGVVIVSTPQLLSRNDVVKAISLYQKFDLPILGIIENMNLFMDDSGNQTTIFFGNSGNDLAAKFSIPFLYQIPILPEISKACDNGTSLVDIVKLPIDFLLK
jgi:ATP-binding protein involved in chromosome partitioning